MKFSIFDSVKAQRGELCTYERFLEVSHSPMVTDICAAIAKEPNHDRQGDLKKQLPVITFNALFESQRKNDLALPSGLFMYDGDGIDNPYQFYSEHVCGRKEELGIVYVGMTPSQHGLRIVARCRKEFTTIAECQQWLGEQIGWPCDPACKDWARSSYVVPDSYIYYMDGKMFSEEPDVVYEVKVNGLKVKETDATTAITEVNKTSDNEHQTSNTGKTQDTFKGLSLKDIAHEWLKATGGEPEQGERNTRIHALAFEMRYITDFNEETLFAVLPRYGMDDQEMRTLIHSACNAPRSKGIPKQLEKVVQQMRSVEMESDDNEADDDLTLNSKLSTLNSQLPPLPPLIRQVASTAPADFLTAVIICQLPLLGTLGSKLRARYLDGSLHSPSFQVSLEAPQASGKSFMNRLAELELQPIIERDEEERQREQEYNERLAEMKVTGMKVTPENRDELLGQRPKGIIRYVPATISITKLLMRLDNARGLHLCAVAEEIDTVTKAFKRGFSSYGDLLRVAFDNGKYGQDYASDTSFSGIVNARYNTLFSGTPKAMRRFYPDVEDGLVSRVCFVALPDQFGKPMPVWGELKERDRRVVEEQRKRLYEVSIVGDTVQPNHEMQLPFLCTFRHSCNS